MKKPQVNKKSISNKLVKYIKIAFALIASIIVLGFAFQGAKQYISVMSGEQQTIAAAMVVTVLVYVILNGYTSLKK